MDGEQGRGVPRWLRRTGRSAAVEGLVYQSKGFDSKCSGKPRQGFKAAKMTLTIVWREEIKQEGRLSQGRELVAWPSGGLDEMWMTLT